MNQRMMTTTTYRPFTDKGSVREYSSVQVNVPQVIAEEIIGWGQDKIGDQELYMAQDRGREDEIHITVLYGIHASSPTRVESLLKGAIPFVVSLGTVSIFTINADFDVIKIDVMGSYLFHLNRTLKENVHNSQVFPSYKPHVTIAYVKKGVGRELVGSNAFKGISWKTNSLVFSSKMGGKTPIRLKAEQGV